MLRTCYGVSDETLQRRLIARLSIAGSSLIPEEAANVNTTRASEPSTGSSYEGAWMLPFARPSPMRIDAQDVETTIISPRCAKMDGLKAAEEAANV